LFGVRVCPGKEGIRANFSHHQPPCQPPRRNGKRHELAGPFNTNKFRPVTNLLQAACEFCFEQFTDETLANLLRTRCEKCREIVRVFSHFPAPANHPASPHETRSHFNTIFRPVAKNLRTFVTNNLRTNSCEPVCEFIYYHVDVCAETWCLKSFHRLPCASHFRHPCPARETVSTGLLRGVVAFTQLHGTWNAPQVSGATRAFGTWNRAFGGRT